MIANQIRTDGLTLRLSERLEEMDGVGVGEQLSGDVRFANHFMEEAESASADVLFGRLTEDLHRFQLLRLVALLLGQVENLSEQYRLVTQILQRRQSGRQQVGHLYAFHFVLNRIAR